MANRILQKLAKTGGSGPNANRVMVMLPRQ